MGKLASAGPHMVPHLWSTWRLTSLKNRTDMFESTDFLGASLWCPKKYAVLTCTVFFRRQAGNTTTRASSGRASRGPVRRGYRRPAYGRPMYTSRRAPGPWAGRYKFARGKRRGGFGYPARRAAAPYQPVMPAFSGMPGMPQRTRARMRFCTQVQSVEMTGNMETHKFKANAPFNPDELGGDGRDAMGWNQLQSVFNRYRVVGSKMRISIQVGAEHDPTKVIPPIMVGLAPSDDDTTLPLDYRTMVELRRGTWSLCQFQESFKRTLMTRWSARKWFAGVSGTTANAGFTGTVSDPNGTNPQDLISFVLWTQPADGTSDIAAAAYQFVSVLDYIVDFFEPRDLAPST